MGIDAQIAVDKGALPFIRIGALDSAQHGAHPAYQLLRAERLGDVIVGAQLQAEDAVDLLAACGQHDDRRVRGGAQPAGDLQPVDFGQHEVKHHQVEALARQQVQRCLTILRGRHLKAGSLQIEADDLSDAGLVIDHQNSLFAHGLHSFLIDRLPRNPYNRLTLAAL